MYHVHPKKGFLIHSNRESLRSFFRIDLKTLHVNGGTHASASGAFLYSL